MGVVLVLLLHDHYAGTPVKNCKVCWSKVLLPTYTTSSFELEFSR